MTRVALLTTSLARGGAESQVVQCAIGLRRRGWETAVVSLLDPAAFAGELASEGVPVHSLAMRPGHANPRGLIRLIGLLRVFRPQILHSHMFHANMAARVVRLFSPVPVVISTLHSVAESSRETAGVQLRDLAYRLTDPLADMVTAVSEAVADRHRSSGAVRAAKLRVIPNGVDTSRYHPDQAHRENTRRELGIEERFVWLAAGRLLWKKDYGSLLRAFARQPDAVLLIAGEGPEGDRLRHQARELAMEARVRFLGAREDLPALMNAADGFVLSSVVEGLPMVLLEAAASGAPAVATDAGGVRECVADGETGFVVPRSDCDALAAAMSRLALLPAEARARMGKAARARAVERFDMDRVVAEWERTYRELLERV
jgi:glycosyltransferase involved in cell wall biosynthesis